MSPIVLVSTAICASISFSDNNEQQRLLFGYPSAINLCQDRLQLRVFADRRRRLSLLRLTPIPTRGDRQAQKARCWMSNAQTQRNNYSSRFGKLSFARDSTIAGVNIDWYLRFCDLSRSWQPRTWRCGERSGDFRSQAETTDVFYLHKGQPGMLYADVNYEILRSCNSKLTAFKLSQSNSPPVSQHWKILTIFCDVLLATRIDSIQQKGRVDIIANDQGHRIMPSWVSFTDNKRLIGDVAKNAFRSNPINTVFDAKCEHVFNGVILL